jgi:Ca2+-binding EF-hand superfamily protein
MMRMILGPLQRAALCGSALLLVIAAPSGSEEAKTSKDAKEPGSLRSRGYEEFDTDGDGRLSKEEQDAAREIRRQRRLKEFDLDRDGKLSDAELEAFYTKQNERRPEQVGRLDTDGDGKLSEVEKEAYRRRNARPPTEIVDTNNDGELSYEERQAAHDRHAERQARELEQFDADGDGKLSREEKRRANAERRKHSQAQGHGPGDPPAINQTDDAPQEP